MQNYIQNKIFIGSLCFILGLGVMYVVQHYSLVPKQLPKMSESRNAKNLNSLFDQFYDDDFFNRSRDPFEEMRKMRERMMKQFDEPNEGTGMFDSWYQKKFGGGSVAEIQKREDEKYVYYDISLKNIDQKKLNVKVENGQIEISAQIEDKSENDNSKSFVSSSFHRFFPVPPEVDPDKVQMEQEKDKLVIKFPKIKSA